jgi:CubicO group peptidase (beta-lactamase class C family)
VAWTAGGIVATADDLATWARALYGGSLLSPASLAEMTDFDRYPAENYGLGTRRRTMDGHAMHGHAGSLRGYMAGMWHLVGDNTTVVVLTNRGRIDIESTIIKALIRRILSDTAAPSVPTGLTPAPRSNRYVQLSWSASIDNMPGAIRYRIFRDGVAIGVRQTTLSYTDRPSVGKHRYQVRSIDMAGNKSARSPAVSVFAYR